MKNVLRSIIAIIAAVFLLETSIGAIILTIVGYLILGGTLLSAFIVVRLYIASVQGHRWEQSQLDH